MIMGCAAYRDGRSVPVPDGSDDEERFNAAARATSGEGDFAWVGLLNPSREELAAVGRAFGIHPLALEDALTDHERPKIDVGRQSLTVVMQPARYDEEHELVYFGQLAVLAAPNHIVVVRHGDALELGSIRDSMEADSEWISQGPGAVLHAIIDKVVDSYAPVIDGITDDIEEVETEVFSPERRSPAQRIYELKREVIQFSKAANPLVAVLRQLSTIEHPLLSHELRKYFSDIGDELQRLADQNLAQRELLTSALEANMTQINIKQNEDMRRISAWGAIIAVPTLVSGVYGMNFAHMPELASRYGYYIVLGAMLLICILLYSYFKKIGWL